jgi:hypothetical protein
MELKDKPTLTKSGYVFTVADGSQSGASGQMVMTFKIGDKTTTQVVYVTPGKQPLFLIGTICMNNMGVDHIKLQPPALVFEDGTSVDLHQRNRKGTYYMRLSDDARIPANGEVLMPVYMDPRSCKKKIELAMCSSSDELWDKYPVMVKEGLSKITDGFGQINLRNMSTEFVYIPGGTMVSICSNETNSKVIGLKDKTNVELADKEKEKYFKYIKEKLFFADSVSDKPESKARYLRQELAEYGDEIPPYADSEEYAREICTEIPSAQRQNDKLELDDDDYELEELEELKKRSVTVGTQTDFANRKSGADKMQADICKSEFVEESMINRPDSLASYVSKDQYGSQVLSEKNSLIQSMRMPPKEAYQNIGDDPMDDLSDDETTPMHLRKKLEDEGFENMFMPEKGPGRIEARKEGQLHEHIKELYKRHMEFIPKNRHRDLYSILLNTQDAYRDPLQPHSVSDVDEHVIDTEENKPFKLRPRRLPSAMTEVVDKEIQEMLENNVISPSESPWSSAIVLVKKKDGSIRFCIDYRTLNLKTKKDSYPLPRIDNCLEALQGSKYFCCLDLASGYWQIKVHEKDREKTAFSSPKGHYEFNVMPFGLCNAPATFQRIMDKILEDLISAGMCVIYLDDVIIVGKSLDEAFANYMTVVNRLSKYNLKLKAAKCNLFRKTVNFLGHIISSEGIATDPAKIRKVETWPEPTRVGHIRSFLGLACYYQRFIPDYGTIVQPLQILTKKDAKFQWKESQQKSFDTLKKLLTKSPILGYPIDGEMFILDTDASNVAAGAVLSQRQNGVERVIAYGTKTFSDSQQNYCTTKRELFAVFHFVTVKYRNYLMRREFLLRSDHISLTWMMNFKQHDSLLNRWVMALTTYSNRWILEHRSGKNHNNADAMSRIGLKFCRMEQCRHCMAYRDPDKPVVPVKQEVDDMVDYCRQPNSYWDKVNGSKKDAVAAAFVLKTDNKNVHELTDIEDGSPGLMHLLYARDETASENGEAEDGMEIYEVLVTTDRGEKVPVQVDPEEPLVPSIAPRDLAVLQDQDMDICRLKILLSIYGEERPSNKQMRMESRRVKNFVIFWEEMKYHNGVLYRTGWNNEFRLVTPFSLQELLLKQVHGKYGMMGHPGETKSKEILCRKFYWPGMRKDITAWVSCCLPCRLAKRGKINNAVLEADVTGARNYRVGIDIIGPLPETASGNRFILTICDYFTKWVECVPLKRHTGELVAQALFNCWISIFGPMAWLHSDQGVDFQSTVMTHLLQLMKISKTRTNPYRPRSAGLVERHNGTIKQSIETMVDGERDKWDEVLPMVCMAYRSMPHSSTGYSPNMMTFGQENNSTLDLIFPPGPEMKDLRSDINCFCSYIQFLRRSLIKTHEVAREKLHSASLKMKFHHDKGAHVLRDFKVGDWVLYWHKPTANRSLYSGWTGPWIVVARINDFTFTIMKEEFGSPTSVHGDYLYLDADHRRPCPWLDSLTKEDIDPKGRRAMFRSKEDKNKKDNGDEWMTIEKYQNIQDRRDKQARNRDSMEESEANNQDNELPDGTELQIAEEEQVNDHNKVIEKAIRKEKEDRTRNMSKKDRFINLSRYQDVRTSSRLKSKDRIDYKRLNDGDEAE